MAQLESAISCHSKAWLRHTVALQFRDRPDVRTRPAGRVQPSVREAGKSRLGAPIVQRKAALRYGEPVVAGPIMVGSRKGAVAWGMRQRPVSPPPHQTGRADFRHPALRLASRQLSGARLLIRGQAEDAQLVEIRLRRWSGWRWSGKSGRRRTWDCQERSSAASGVLRSGV